jgi:hypothetical protein
MIYLPPIASIRRFSSAVEQRFCKPKVGSSILSTGTICLLRPHPGRETAGTNLLRTRFPVMRIREENCNMILLAVVASLSVAIAGSATLLGFADNTPVQFADRTTGRVEQAPSPDKRIIYVSDQPPVRVIGAPFVPNTNPRER